MLNHMNYFRTAFLLALLISCNEGNKSTKTNLIPVGEGRLAVNGGNIWYKVTGEGSGVPLILLHGGPGYSSFYLKPLEELGKNRQVIRYDQLGAGKSDVVVDTSLFTTKHFVEELEALRQHLNVEKWNVLGHSWGTILAFEYYRNYPDRVSSLVLGSPCINMNAWEQSTNQLLATLPDSLQKVVLEADATGNYENPLYDSAITMFYDKYLWGENPNEEELDSIMSTANLDIYHHMWGPSEFSITGTLKGYDATPLLSDVDVPILFTVGEFDEIIPEMVEEMASINNSELVVFKGSSHLTTWGAPEESIKAIEDFISSLNLKK